MTEKPNRTVDSENSPAVNVSATVDDPDLIEVIEADGDGRVTLDLGAEAAGRPVHVAAHVEEGDHE